MANFYYQHVGGELAARDFPRSLGTSQFQQRQFSWKELLSWPEFTDAHNDLPRMEKLFGPNDCFQIWGLPRGAEAVTKRMGSGDELMLMSSKSFDYIGTVAHRLSSHSEAMSRRIWGEDKFSIIVLLQDSQFIKLPWDDFRSKLNFDKSFHMRGNTMKLSASRLIASGFSDVAALSSWCRRYRES